MAGQKYATDTARDGVVKGQILKTAISHEVLSSAGETVPMQGNQGDTYKWKRFMLPSGVDNQWIVPGGDDDWVNRHETAEGVTAEADSITSTIISVVPTQYTCLYTYSDKTAEMFEDDIPMQEVEFAGKRIRLVREMYNYGILKATTNAFYAGGTSTATVDEAISANMLRRVKRDLQRYYADPTEKALAGSPDYATYPVDSAYVVYTHTDQEADLYDLTGFVKVAEYGSRKAISPREIGSWESFRFITCPELSYYPAGGAVIGTTGLKADDATNIDVYPMIVMGADAFKQVALRGMSAIDSTHIPHSQRSKSDPGGQRGYVWAGTWHAAAITNQDWVACIETGVTDL